MSYLTVSASAGATTINHSQTSYVHSVWWILQWENPSRVPGTARTVAEGVNQHTEAHKLLVGGNLLDYPKFPNWKAPVAMGRMSCCEAI